MLSSVLLSLIAFFVGDQWILRNTNNTVATLTDIGLAGMYFSIIGVRYNWGLTFAELLSIVVVLAVVEWIPSYFEKLGQEQNSLFPVIN